MIYSHHIFCVHVLQYVSLPVHGNFKKSGGAYAPHIPHSSALDYDKLYIHKFIYSVGFLRVFVGVVKNHNLLPTQTGMEEGILIGLLVIFGPDSKLGTGPRLVRSLLGRALRLATWAVWAPAVVRPVTQHHGLGHASALRVRAIGHLIVASKTNYKTSFSFYFFILFFWHLQNLLICMIGELNQSFGTSSLIHWSGGGWDEAKVLHAAKKRKLDIVGHHVLDKMLNCLSKLIWCNWIALNWSLSMERNFRTSPFPRPGVMVRRADRCWY